LRFKRISNNFFLKAYLITFQTSIFSSGSAKGFAQSKQKSAEKILKMRFLQGAKKMLAARRDWHR
jgi:hypothetical protein